MEHQGWHHVMRCKGSLCDLKFGEMTGFLLLKFSIVSYGLLILLLLLLLLLFYYYYYYYYCFYYYTTAISVHSVSC